MKKTVMLPELNWIRGISALLIVLYHYTTQYEKSIGHIGRYPVMLPWGCGAVNVFFMLTAFLTIYSLSDSSNPIQFGLKRAKRLYPSYWSGIVLTSVIMRLLLPEYARSLPVIVINLTMLQGFFGIENVDGVYWTLSYEIIFYFYIAALLVLKLVSTRSIKRLSIAWILLSAVYFCLETAGITGIFMRAYRLAFMPYFAAPFVGGMSLAVCAKDKKRDYIALGTGIVSIVFSFLVQELAYALLYCIAAVIVYAVIEMRLIRSSERYMNCVSALESLLKPISFIASISYPLYLLHQFIGYAVIYNLEAAGVTSEWSIVIPIAVSIGMAFVVHYCVELPIDRKLKRAR